MISAALIGAGSAAAAAPADAGDGAGEAAGDEEAAGGAVAGAGAAAGAVGRAGAVTGAAAATASDAASAHAPHKSKAIADRAGRGTGASYRKSRGTSRELFYARNSETLQNSRHACASRETAPTR